MDLLPRRRGFTLIELLVVIAIINVLSAIVLASLSKARQNANDVAIRANLATIQVQAEVYAYANGNNYGASLSNGDCFITGSTRMVNDSTINKALTAIKNIGAGTIEGHDKSTVCNIRKTSNETGYAIQAQLMSGDIWCIDSAGTNRVSLTFVGIGTNPENVACPP